MEEEELLYIIQCFRGLWIPAYGNYASKLFVVDDPVRLERAISSYKVMLRNLGNNRRKAGQLGERISVEIFKKDKKELIGYVVWEWLSSGDPLPPPPGYEETHPDTIPSLKSVPVDLVQMHIEAVSDNTRSTRWTLEVDGEVREIDAFLDFFETFVLQREEVSSLLEVGQLELAKELSDFIDRYSEYRLHHLFGDDMTSGAFRSRIIRNEESVNDIIQAKALDDFWESYKALLRQGLSESDILQLLRKKQT